MAKNPSLQASRAIASMMVQRYIFLPLITLTTIGAIAWVFSLTLATFYSQWWLLLAFVLFLWLVLGIITSVLGFLMVAKLRPRKLSRTERRQIMRFISALGASYGAPKGLQKTPTALSAVVAWKYVKGRGKQPVSGIITNPIDDIKDLAVEFNKLTKLF